MKHLLLLFSILLSAYIYSDALLPRAENLINPEQIKRTIIFVSDNIYLTTLDHIAGDKIIRSFHTSIDPSNESIGKFDNDILDYPTLRPLFKKHPYGTIEYHYLKDNIVKMTFHFTHEGTEESVVKEVETPYHNYVMSGPSLPVLITALPLKIGLKVKFSAIGTHFPYSKEIQVPVVDYIVEVVGTEDLSFDNEEYATFIVEIYPENDGAEGVYFKGWFTKDIPYIKLQNIYTSSENKGKDNSKRIHKASKLPRFN